MSQLMQESRKKGQIPSSFTFCSIQAHNGLNNVYLPTFQGFSDGASGKKPAYQCRRGKRHRFDLWVGKIPWREVHGSPFQYSCLENPWTQEAGRLYSTGLQRVRNDLNHLAQHLHIGGQSALSPQIQILISPRNTLADTNRNNI